MKTITALFACLCLTAAAQTVTPIAPTVATVAMPTYISAGASFNQIGNPRVNLFASAVYPVASSLGLYLSTSTDIAPVQIIDPITKRVYWGFSSSVRQGVHKQVYAAGNWRFLIGGDAGAGFSQAQPSGVNVSLAGSFQATIIYRFKPQWAVVVPLGGVYINGAWNLIPRIGISFKP
jgi:hypothetical protein